jgi:hypothetical protein
MNGWSSPYCERSAAICSAESDEPEEARVATYAVRKSPGGAWMMAKMMKE